MHVNAAYTALRGTDARTSISEHAVRATNSRSKEWREGNKKLRISRLVAKRSTQRYRRRITSSTTNDADTLGDSVSECGWRIVGGIRSEHDRWTRDFIRRWALSAGLPSGGEPRFEHGISRLLVNNFGTSDLFLLLLWQLVEILGHWR